MVSNSKHIPEFRLEIQNSRHSSRLISSFPDLSVVDDHAPHPGLAVGRAHVALGGGVASMSAAAGRDTAICRHLAVAVRPPEKEKLHG